MREGRKKILAVASFGGHLAQLRRILGPLEGCDIVWVSTYDQIFENEDVHIKVQDFSRQNWYQSLSAIFRFLKIIKHVKPTHIVSTGAAPGLAAIIAAKLMGIPSLWIDSMANIISMSLSGKIAKYFATQWFTYKLQDVFSYNKDGENQEGIIKEQLSYNNIFVTTGTQEPFDRLIKYIDIWKEYNKGVVIYAQSIKGEYVPHNFQVTGLMTPTEYDAIFKDVDLIIGHAGMGTIIKALELGKPVIVFPREKAEGEHRSDHQKDTVNFLPPVSNIKIAQDAQELWRLLDNRKLLFKERKQVFLNFSKLTRKVNDFLEKF